MIRFGMLVLLVLMLTACGGGDEDAAVDPGSGDLGAVEIAPGAAIQIRTLLTNSVEADISLPMRRSAEIAISDYGAIHGRTIELGEPLDSACSPEGGRAGALKIAASGNAAGVIGTACSAAAVAASPILSDAGMVMISPSNTSPGLTSNLAGNPNADYHPGYYRTANNDLYQATTVADFAFHQLELRFMTTVDDGDPYTRGLTTAFRRAFERPGGTVTQEIRIEQRRRDMADVLGTIAGCGDVTFLPEGIFFPLFTEEGITSIQQARAFDSVEANFTHTVFITGTGLLTPSFLELQQALGVYLAGPSRLDPTSVNQATGMRVEQVLDAYQAFHGSPQTPYWAHAYDAMTLLSPAPLSPLPWTQTGRCILTAPCCARPSPTPKTSADCRVQSPAMSSAIVAL